MFHRNAHKQRHDILRKFYQRPDKLKNTDTSLNVFVTTRNNLYDFRIRDNETLLILSWTYFDTALQKKQVMVYW